MIRINQINVSAGQTAQKKALMKKAAQILNIQERDILSLDIIRQSIDARKKPDIYYSYVVDVTTGKDEKLLKKNKNPQVSFSKPEKYEFPVVNQQKELSRPVIVGAGPAGLFCGYYLAKAGFCPILLERGRDVDARMQDVEQFWSTGHLKPDSNVQFGEGGAGTFSDGKLNTLVKDKDGRNRAVLETFVQFGAEEKILYDAKPHIGTDVLCRIVKAMREEIIRLGGEVRFESKVTGLVLEQVGSQGCDNKEPELSENRTGDLQIKGVRINGAEELSCTRLVLAIGHSARDTFEMLYGLGVPMEAKSFAVGLRVEHPQALINESQYGRREPGHLQAAPYKVTAKTSVGRGVYSFCMCPGGYVVNASSEEGRLAVNGMSYSGRDGANANSAIIVSVTPEDFGSEHPLAGIAFQRKLEERAYELGEGKIPVQRYGEFREKVTGSACYEKDERCLMNQRNPADLQDLLEPQNKGQWTYADVSRILPQECNAAFVEGMQAFGKMIPGFDREDCLLSGVESRTSSPVRITRNESMMSVVKGFYPCGEGAGYAGGITSAAMDGIRVAEAVAKGLTEAQK